MTPKPASAVSLGLGNDLDPKMLRWMIPGGIGGFILWAINAPESMPFHALFHLRGPTQVVTLVMGGMYDTLLRNDTLFRYTFGYSSGQALLRTYPCQWRRTNSILAIYVPRVQQCLIHSVQDTF